MSPIPPVIDQAEREIAQTLDRLASCSAMQSNCMFQLALMVARIAAEPCADSYKAEAAQTLMDLIRAKPKSNVVRLFGASHAAEPPSERSTVVQFAAR